MTNMVDKAKQRSAGRRGSVMDGGRVMRWVFAALWGACGLLPRIGHASEPPPEPDIFVITATRVETPLEEVASSITVIGEEEIQTGQHRTVLDVLRDVPALDVVQSGGEGQTTSVFIRGANSQHTLVLIDGVEANDPSDGGRAFDFAHLTTGNIERIEILRGPQSVLYGSDAMGGVINIITRKGRGEPSGFLTAEGGSFDTFRASAGLQGGTDAADFSVFASTYTTGGISAASEEDDNRENDPYRNRTLSARIGVHPAEALRFDVMLRATDSFSEIDNAAGVGGDDPNHVVDARQIFLRTSAGLSLFDGRWEQELAFAYTDHIRNVDNDTDADHPADSSESDFHGRLYMYDWQHDILLHDSNTLTLGVELEQENSDTRSVTNSMFGTFVSRLDDKDATTTGYYVQDQIRLFDSFFATLGARVDAHQRFGTATTYRIAPAYVIRRTHTRLKASYGTGFKAPTLFQLFSAFGDDDLDPEKSRGWDAGFEQELWDGKLRFGLTYFENAFDDLITFNVGTFVFENLSEATTSGVEAFLDVRPLEDLKFSIQYTHLDTEDKETGEDLLRRAGDKMSAGATWWFLEKRGLLHLNVRYEGERDDRDFTVFPAERVTLDSFTIMDLTSSYTVRDSLRVFGRIENLLDTEYDQVEGFGTQGIAAYVGATLSF